MRKGNCIIGIMAILCIVVCTVSPDSAFSQIKTMTAAELVAKHLSSIGKPEALAQMKSRIISGKAAVQFIQGAGGQLTDGQFGCASDGRSVGMLMKFADNKYPGEHFAYNGKEVTVGNIQPGVKSPIADFLFRYNTIMKDGLLGGLLTVAWPLLNEQERQLGLQYAQEKIDERMYHVLEVTPSKKSGDMKIKLYFDPETFRHVRTEYKVRTKYDMTGMASVAPGTGPASRDQNAVGGRPADRDPKATIQESQPDNIYSLTEKFGNFASVGGLMLPRDYTIEYSQEGHLAVFLAKWAVMIEYWKPNSTVNPEIFVAQK